MEVKKELSDFKKRLDRELAVFFEEEKKRAEKVDNIAVWLVERLAEFTLRGGKRLRPAFLYWGYKACGGKEEKEIMKICLAVELTESWVLIADDLMDKDERRRGRPSVHILFEKEAGKLGMVDRKHFGMVGAILVSFLGMQMVDRLIIGSGFSDDKKLLVLGKLKELLMQVFFGQMMDVVVSKRSERFNEKMIKKITEYKTAKYTVELPLVLGGLLAGKKEKELGFFKKYGEYLGEAFQLKDDILGISGDPRRTGKSVLSDMREGKKTLLALLALKNLQLKTPTCAKASVGRYNLKLRKFKKIWGNQQAGVRELRWIRKIFEETGVQEEVMEQARNLVLEAKKEIKRVFLERKGKQFLMKAADFVIEREK